MPGVAAGFPRGGHVPAVSGPVAPSAAVEGRKPWSGLMAR